MADETQPADSSNDTPVETPSSQEEAVEAATESVDELRNRIKELESRRTNEGRSSKAIKAEKEELAAKLADREDNLSKKEAELEKWNVWYVSKYGTPAQKATLAAKQSRPAGGDNQSKAEVETWRAIAEEENPQIKKILARSAKTGDFLSKKQIESLRASFDDDEEDDSPPKVKPVRTTGSTEETLEQKLARAKKAGNASEVLRLSSQLAARKAKRD